VTINLYNTDCMQALRDMPDNMYDLAIVDPPYRDVNQPTKDMRNNGSMETIQGRPSAEYWEHLHRVSRNQIIWGANNFELPQWKGFLVWKKKSIGVNFTMSMCEVASISEDLGTVSKWIEIAPQNPYRIHPTQKPVQLYEWILHHYANAGDRILDTHLGSGSIAVACHNMGYSLDAYEIDAGYFAAASARLYEHQRQYRLFI